MIIALNGPQESSAATITEFQHLFLSLGFLIFGSMIILAALIIIFFIAPKYELRIAGVSLTWMSNHVSILLSDGGIRACYGTF